MYYSYSRQDHSYENRDEDREGHYANDEDDGHGERMRGLIYASLLMPFLFCTRTCRFVLNN
jgi:hypothetical protein